ncbi:uncharacterized protein LOC130137308 [Syzygium oleosum]|uniref:uncharacterized protein LOC130137308 n=1 Tax=Syzygium oleosum TaxID=219896 RepID=UPI0024B8DE3F|nr:uncharacterized protein LOC130137308 [Syzygium oleosum]
MANYPPAALARLVELSEQRRTRDLEHSRALSTATRNGKRAVSEAQGAFIEAKEAYSSEGYRVLNRSRLTVHNQEQIKALLELLDEVEPPYLLYRVTVNGPVPDEDNVDPLVQQMRQSLEARGFALVGGNTYALPNTEANAQG